jgi:predicted enzyme related to lactoylglutathione lyase
MRATAPRSNEGSEMAELSFPAGTPSWVDVSSTEPSRTRAFYLDMFDWDVEEIDNSEGYCLFRHNGLLVAGVSPAPSPDDESMWNTYITVADADEAARAALGSGGSVRYGPMDVGDRGRMALLVDPAGAAISVWQPGAVTGAELVNSPGAFCWNELQSHAASQVKGFYQAVFGWEGRTSDFGGIPYTEWLRDGDSVAGMMAMPPTVPDDVAPFWLVYFSVENCDESVARARAIGAEVLVPPFASPAGRFSVLQDPLGASFAVITFAA